MTQLRIEQGARENINRAGTGGQHRKGARERRRRRREEAEVGKPTTVCSRGSGGGGGGPGGSGGGGGGDAGIHDCTCAPAPSGCPDAPGEPPRRRSRDAMRRIAARQEIGCEMIKTTAVHGIHGNVDSDDENSGATWKWRSPESE